MQDEFDAWFNVSEAAEYLGVTDRWMRRQIESRTIDFNKVGGKIRFRQSVLDEILEHGDVPAERPLIVPHETKRRYRTTEADVA
jgi:excisionase family DNA binding protein